MKPIQIIAAGCIVTILTDFIPTISASRKLGAIAVRTFQDPLPATVPSDHVDNESPDELGAGRGVRTYSVIVGTSSVTVTQGNSWSPWY